MARKIRVGILEDHQSVIDGYLYRLHDQPDIEVVAIACYGEELAQMLATHDPIHVLTLDINVPTSAKNSNPYPILHLIPKLQERYPALNILVISMYKQATVIRAATEAGAHGYVLKDDRETLQAFDSVIRTVASGGIYFSKEAHEQLLRKTAGYPKLSARQLEVLSLCATYPDKTSADIAEIMGVADATVRNLLSSAYTRLDVRSRTSAVERAKDLGLLAATETYPSTPLP